MLIIVLKRNRIANDMKQFTFLETIWYSVVGVFIGCLYLIGQMVDDENWNENSVNQSIYRGVVVICELVIPVLVVRITCFSKTKVTLQNNIISIKRNSLIKVPIKDDLTLRYKDIEKVEIKENSNNVCTWNWVSITHKNGIKYSVWQMEFWKPNKNFSSFCLALKKEIKQFKKVNVDDFKKK